MRGSSPHVAEIVRRGDEALPEQVLPQPVDDDARKKRRHLRIDHLSREAKSAGPFGGGNDIVANKRFEEPPGSYFAQFLVIATQVHPLVFRSAIGHRHHLAAVANLRPERCPRRARKVWAVGGLRCFGQQCATRSGQRVHGG